MKDACNQGMGVGLNLWRRQHVQEGLEFRGFRGLEFRGSRVLGVLGLGFLGLGESG